MCSFPPPPPDVLLDNVDRHEFLQRGARIGENLLEWEDAKTNKSIIFFHNPTLFSTHTLTQHTLCDTTI